MLRAMTYADGAGLVEIARDFLVAHRDLRQLFEAQRRGALCWDEVQRLVGPDERSVLFRLKERSHALFRAGAGAVLPRVALFDLAVGSLFHEAMKLRENVYQLEVYAPKVEAARLEAESGTEPLFEEFTRILRGSRARLREALDETESLLGQTRRQFRVLLAMHRENGFLARYLLENAALVEDVLGEPFDALFASIHGDPVAGYARAAHSYLESGYFDEARCALAAADARDPGRASLRADVAYAEGMSAWLHGAYEQAIEHLERWVETSPAAADAPFRSLALAAVSRIAQLVEGERAEALAGRAAALGRALGAA